MTALKVFGAVVFGFSGGVIIAGGVFAFIAIIGVVPRLAQKTGTQRYARIYEEAIMLGGILGTASDVWDFKVPIGIPLATLISFCDGVFLGCIAMSLAEVLDVIPIMTRRTKVQQGMFFFVLAIALGKFLGTLAYYIIPGFYKPH